MYYVNHVLDKNKAQDQHTQFGFLGNAAEAGSQAIS
jgi:hypothetical protein